MRIKGQTPVTARIPSILSGHRDGRWRTVNPKVGSSNLPSGPTSPPSGGGLLLSWGRQIPVGDALRERLGPRLGLWDDSIPQQSLRRSVGLSSSHVEPVEFRGLVRPSRVSRGIHRLVNRKPFQADVGLEWCCSDKEDSEMVTPQRSVPRSVARVLQALELEQPVLVTLDQLDDLAAETGAGFSGSVAARLLRERGWLLPLRATGVWEFAPGARAGAVGGGDPFIELRARLKTRPLPVAVAAESAAWLHGLASRSPEPHVVGLPPGKKLPKSLDGFRVVRWVPTTPIVDVDGLPAWSVDSLVGFMGARPDRYRDWPNVSEWLADATQRVSVDALRSELAEQPRSGWARTSYLLFLGGASQAADALFASAPQGRGPFHLGPRTRPSRYERRFEVVDHVFPTSWSIKAVR